MSRAKLIDIDSRSIISSTKDNDIYHNGIDNDYPDRIEVGINNSTTAKLCVKKMMQFLIGRGFDVNNNYVTNSKGETLNDLLCNISRDIPYQKYFTIHVNYNENSKVNTFSFIKAKTVRVSKEDLFDNSGLIWVSDNWAGSNLRSKKKSKGRKFYYPYNPDPQAILAQRKRDYEIYIKDNEIKESDLTDAEKIRIMLQAYRGQVMYVNLDNNNVYPNAYVDAAINDIDTEYRISNFRNKQVREGFIGSTIFTILDNGDESQDIVTDENLKAIMGSDNSHKILKIKASANENGDLAEVIKATTIKSDIDTERFQYDEKKIEEHILNSYSIPKILVMNSDNSVFGNSGEAYRVAQQIFNDETLFERNEIEKAVNKILSNIENPFSVKINPLIQNNGTTS